LEVVRYLISKGANIHAGNNAALKCAVRCKKLNIVRYLISKGADVKEIDYKELVLYKDRKLVYFLWNKLPVEDILPFLTSDSSRLRKAVKEYLERRGYEGT
jgi:hypothetical protein